MGKFDEFFDDVVVNAKTAAEAVSKKAAQVYDASRHKFTAAEIRGDINKKLKDLGKFTYKERVHGVDMSADIDATIAEIKELKENLEIINNHLDDIMEQKKCPQCEAKVPKNSLFCNICGAKIDEDKVDEASQEDETIAAVAEESAEEVIDSAEEVAAAAVEEAEDKAEEKTEEKAEEAAE